MLVTTHARLVELCHAIRATGVCGFDTEFVSERSYWPRLGLVQIAAPGGPAGAVDPLAINDLSPLSELLLAPDMTIVVHAGSMDWKILAKQTGRLPAHTFDTQIAASFLGYGLQVGYGVLVEAVLGRRIDKTETYTDWLKRPLTPHQIEYAVGDVTHLLELHVALEAELRRRGRLEWATQEFAASVNLDHHRDPDPYLLYTDVRRVGGMGRRDLAVLRDLVAWRELEARERDVRPNFIVKDEVLLAAAKRVPRTEHELSQIRAASGHEVARVASAIVRVVLRALALPEAEWPDAHRPDPLDMGLDPTVNLLQSYVQTRSKDAELASEVVAPRAVLKALAKGGPDAVRGDGASVLAGWRREVLGPDFQALLRGEAAVAIDPVTRKIRVVPVPDVPVG
jgi:ribonuclease D